MLNQLSGKVAYIFNELDFDVDQIIGVKNIKIQDLETLADLAMKDYEPNFRQSVQPGDILIGAANFGYGHPHYPPMRTMRFLGISAVIAESFAPTFWRGEISMGFPLISCKGILALVSRGDTISVNWAEGCVTNVSTGQTLPFEPLSASDYAMLKCGGLIHYLKNELSIDNNLNTEG
ncbi:hypothetical protein ACSUAE_03535 [Acinetobacter baumannii]